MSGKNRAGNEEHNFLIRSYRLEIKKHGMWSQVKNKKKPREGKHEVSGERHSENRAL